MGERWKVERGGGGDSIHASSPILSRSLPDKEWIFRSPARVSTEFQGKCLKYEFSLHISCICKRALNPKVNAGSVLLSNSLNQKISSLREFWHGFSDVHFHQQWYKQLVHVFTWGIVHLGSLKALNSYNSFSTKFSCTPQLDNARYNNRTSY